MGDPEKIRGIELHNGIRNRMPHSVFPIRVTHRDHSDTTLTRSPAEVAETAELLLLYSPHMRNAGFADVSRRCRRDFLEHFA